MDDDIWYWVNICCSNGEKVKTLIDDEKYDVMGWGGGYVRDVDIKVKKVEDIRILIDKVNEENLGIIHIRKFRTTNNRGMTSLEEICKIPVSEFISTTK